MANLNLESVCSSNIRHRRSKNNILWLHSRLWSNSSQSVLFLNEGWSRHVQGSLKTSLIYFSVTALSRQGWPRWPLLLWNKTHQHTACTPCVYLIVQEFQPYLNVLQLKKKGKNNHQPETWLSSEQAALKQDIYLRTLHILHERLFLHLYARNVRSA